MRSFEAMRAPKPGATCTAAAPTRARGRCCWRPASSCARPKSRSPPPPAWRASASAASRCWPSSPPATSSSSRASRCSRTRSAAPTPTRIVSALREHGFQRVADDHIHDDADELRERLKFHLDTHDVLVLSRRRVDGALRPRAQGARGARRAHGVPQGGAAARQAAVVRRVAPRARPSSRCPATPSRRWCASRVMYCRRCSAAWARTPPPAERIALGAPVTVTAAAHLLPAGARWSRTTGAAPGPFPRPTNGSGDFTAPGGHRWVRGAAPGPQYLPQGAS